MTTPNQTPLAWGGAGMQLDVQSEGPSFVDVMSEDLANDLQTKYNEELLPPITRQLVTNEAEFINPDTHNDLLLAQNLQYEYDREVDQDINRKERHMNKNQKVGVSLNNFKMCPQWYGEDFRDQRVDIDDEKRWLDSFEEHNKKTPKISSAKGYCRYNNQIITKHDSVINGRKNAQSMMDFPPDFNTGDAGGFDIKLSNKVYNKLHKCAINESKRKHKVVDKIDKATTNLSIDMNARMNVLKMTNTGIVEEINGLVCTGKESVILHVTGGLLDDFQLPEEIVMKVFKTTLTDFKNREIYIREDYRFKNRLPKNNNKGIVNLWAEKEFHNLKRLNEAQIPSPEPFYVRNNIILMSYLGFNRSSAPQLKTALLSEESWNKAYDLVVEGMIRMYNRCHLVHADLSEYNILWLDEKCWFIDLGQAVEPTHPSAMDFLMRDCRNIAGFFSSKGVESVISPEDLFEKITQKKIDPLGGVVPCNEDLSYSEMSEEKALKSVFAKFDGHSLLDEEIVESFTD